MKTLALFALIFAGCIGGRKQQHTPEAPTPTLAQTQQQWAKEAGQWVLADTTATR